MQDPVKVLKGTAISTNAFVVPVLIHWVQARSGGTTAITVGLIAGSTNTTVAELEIVTNATGHATVLFEQDHMQKFDPPVRMGDNIANTYVNISGSATWRVGYTMV